jgi:transcriptional regulator with XRE-family HTH domain
MAGSLHLYLRAHRKRRGLTLEKVAAAMSISKSSLSGKENGHKPVNLEELEKLAVIYTESPLALLSAPVDGTHAEAMRQAAEIVRTSDEEAMQHWLSMGRYLPRRGINQS